MAANSATPTSHEPAELPGAAAADAAEGGVSGHRAASPVVSSDATHAPGSRELDGLLKTLDSPELASIRRLFNMC